MLQAGAFQLVARMLGSTRRAEAMSQQGLCGAGDPDPAHWVLDARRLQRRWDAGRPGVLRIQPADRYSPACPASPIDRGTKRQGGKDAKEQSVAQCAIASFPEAGPGYGKAKPQLVLWSHVGSTARMESAIQALHA